MPICLISKLIKCRDSNPFQFSSALQHFSDINLCSRGIVSRQFILSLTFTYEGIWKYIPVTRLPPPRGTLPQKISFFHTTKFSGYLNIFFCWSILCLGTSSLPRTKISNINLSILVKCYTILFTYTRAMWLPILILSLYLVKQGRQTNICFSVSVSPPFISMAFATDWSKLCFKFN